MCNILCSFIREDSCSHMYVLPNIISVREAWMCCKSAASMLSLSTNCTEERSSTEFFFHGLATRKVAQVFFLPLCVSQRLSLVLNAFTVLRISEMICPCPCSCRFIAVRWLMMLHRNAISHKGLLSWSSVVFPFVFHEIRHLFTQLQTFLQQLSLVRPLHFYVIG